MRKEKIRCFHFLFLISPPKVEPTHFHRSQNDAHGKAEIANKKLQSELIKGAVGETQTCAGIEVYAMGECTRESFQNIKTRLLFYYLKFERNCSNT